MTTPGRLSLWLLRSGLILLAACGKDSISVDRVVMVTVAPPTDTLIVGDTVRLSVIVKGASGKVLPDRVITWTSSDISIAVVSANGLVTAIAANIQAATITASAEGVSGSAAIAVMPPAMTVTAVSPDSGPLVGGTVVIIWGSNFINVTGVSIGGRELVSWALLSPTQITGTTTSVAAPGSADVTVTSDTNRSGTCIACFSYFAMAAGDTLRYSSIVAGPYHTCGRTLAGAPYCWGYNGWGQLGNGSTSDALTPHPVSGGLAFTALSAAGGHSCGILTGGAVYCWGSDYYGELGAGGPGPEICSDPSTQFPCSTLPLAVAGGLMFSSLSTGWAPGCALTADGAAYCWGDNTSGELGIGGDTTNLGTCVEGACSRTPLAVAGGLAFTAVVAGNGHACGLTTSGVAYCWGLNSAGQLGVGVSAAPDSCTNDPCSRAPILVAGGLTFTALSAGLFHTCGHATDGDWYCWGLNNYGQLGNGMTGPEVCQGSQGTVMCSSTPIRVSVGTFSIVTAGRRHSCGLSVSGSAYCWGWNDSGQLGDGTTTTSLTPVAVAGGLSFASLSLYWYHTCGLTIAGVAYCWGSNAEGQLGDGTTNDSPVPARVAAPGGSTAITAARAGIAQYHSPVPVASLRLSPP